ncbi:MAG: zf-HC2 domain-containing protein [Nocardioidaceae bacterium]
MGHLGDEVAALVDGQLSDEQTDAAQAHLSLCAECRQKVRAQELAKLHVTTLREIEPSPTLMSSLSDLDRVRDAASQAGTWRHRSRRWLRPRTVVGSVGAVCAVLVGTAYAIGGTASDQRPVRPPMSVYVTQYDHTVTSVSMH